MNRSIDGGLSYFQRVGKNASRAIRGPAKESIDTARYGYCRSERDKQFSKFVHFTCYVVVGHLIKDRRQSVNSIDKHMINFSRSIFR